MVPAPVNPPICQDHSLFPLPPPSSGPVRILLVEDDEDDFILTRDTLKEIPHLAYTLDWVATFEEGLAQVQQCRHDLYLLDFHLGAHSGLDLLRIGREEGNEAPVILLTGSGGELVAAEALRLGATDYMTKSLMSAKTLNRSISNALEKLHLRRTIIHHQQHLEATNKALKKKNQEIKRFYHTLAHELKTPLTAIREFTALIHDGLAGPTTPEQREYLSLSLECIDQITNQINDLLDITRIDTGKLQIHPSPENLEVLIKSVVASLKPEARHKGIAISVSLHVDPPVLWIDKSRITQVFNNLISNAIKFTPPGGSIEVEASNTRNNPSSVVISVRDTGKGIAPEHLDHIFDRLFQADDGHTRAERGLGLGLTITREIIKLHGGQITVRSQLGKGTEFTVTLPRKNVAVLDYHPMLGDEGEAQDSTR